jgi:signal transduction histidine kinase/ActR/RegA family two-component response regulator
MRKDQKSGSKKSQLEARIQYLEGINQLTLDALDQAARLGDFQTSINKLHSPSLILEETRSRIRSLIPFEADAFYMVDESNSEFYLEECAPEEYRSTFLEEIENFIENGTFAWAMRDERPIFVAASDGKKKILLHIMTTSSRVRGMFAGILTHGEMDVPLVSLSLMSIILRYSANALESFELYSMIRGINKNLEQTVKDRTKELQYQLDFEHLVAGIMPTFVNITPEGTCHAVKDSLHLISKFIGADKNFIAIFEENEDLLGCLLDAGCSDKVMAPTAFSIRDSAEYPYILEHTRKEEALFIPALSALPDSANKEKEFLRSLKLKSAVMVPMLSGTTPLGFFGFGFKKAEPGWSLEIGKLLIIVGEIFVSALKRMKTEIALQNSREQLRQAQKMEALGRLAGGVAHDFNNILTAITIAAEVSLQYPGIQDKVVHKFHEILRSSERATNLTRQLLAVSRRQMIKPRLLDVSMVTWELSKMLSRLIPEDIEIIIEPGENLPPIKADPGQIEQILINLAVNARDAIDDNPTIQAEKTITINISKTLLGHVETAQNIVPKPGVYIQIRVSDTGIGMDEETCGKIFEPFFTTKKEEKGTGLGLATVYGIVKQNNGGITVESEPGKGTAFNIFWPEAETPHVAEMEAPLPNHETGGEETILLVEDDADIRKKVLELLLAKGYNVLEAANGQAALEKAKEHKGPVHLLVTDVTMPVMDGNELADRLRKIMPNIKIIFTSGYTDDPLSITESLPANSLFIQKPYSVKNITKLIRELLDDEVT